MSRSRVLQTEAIVIKRTDFGEADRILTLYTPHSGKLRAVAKGARRPSSKLGGHVELCTHVNLLLARGRDLDIVTQAETVHSFIGLREELTRAGLACYVAELVDRLTGDHVENSALFGLLLATLSRLDQGHNPTMAVHVYELRLLGHLGYRPELQHCLQCATTLRPDGTFFHVAIGGALCQGCGTRQPAARVMSANAFKLLRLMQSGDYPTAARVRLDKALKNEVDGLLHSYVTYILESEPRSSSVLRDLAATGHD